MKLNISLVIINAINLTFLQPSQLYCLNSELNVSFVRKQIAVENNDLFLYV